MNTLNTTHKACKKYEKVWTQSVVLKPYLESEGLSREFAKCVGKHCRI
jgi:hypothetical protein